MFNNNPYIVSYNTSFLNDCHNNQTGNPLSESAALVRKAINIYLKFNNKPNDKQYSTELEQNIKSTFGDTYDELRKEFSKRSTEYFYEK